jgi:hypothetical protein
MPCLRQASAVVAPASCSRKSPIDPFFGEPALLHRRSQRRVIASTCFSRKCRRLRSNCERIQSVGREAGVKPGSEAAGRRTGTGQKAGLIRAIGPRAANSGINARQRRLGRSCSEGLWSCLGITSVFFSGRDAPVNVFVDSGNCNALFLLRLPSVGRTWEITVLAEGQSRSPARPFLT